MNTALISFSFQHDDNFIIPDAIVDWIKDTIEAEGQEFAQLDFIICSDEFLLTLNKKYLNHDTYTDIITFPLQENPIVAEIYLSLDRVLENAKHFGKSPENEFMRVCIHGVLHLCGFPDKTTSEKTIMRKMEDKYLQKALNININIC